MPQLEQVSGAQDTGKSAHWNDIAAQQWPAEPIKQTSGRGAASGSVSDSEAVNTILVLLPLEFSAEPGEQFVIPVGAHSKDKKKNVPLEPIEKPDPKLPDVWNHPPATWADGKCGITGVANMLRLYGVERDPAGLDTSDHQNWGPGLRMSQFGANMNDCCGGKKFKSCTIDSDKEDPYKVLKGHIDQGKPVAIEYMTGALNAHWVVVTGIKEGGKEGPELTVQSWGRYYKVKWNDIKSNWERGWGGPYPHVVGDEPSPFLKKPVATEKK